MGLSLEQEALAYHLGFDAAVFQIIMNVVWDSVPKVPPTNFRDNAAWPFRENGYWQEGYEWTPCLGCCIRTGEKDYDVRNTGKSVRRDYVRALRPPLLNLGYLVWLDSTNICVYKTTDPYDVVRLVQPRGDFLESVDDVMAVLTRWETMFRWALLQAGVCGFEIELLTIPDDVLTLAQDVHRLCPEVCGSVYGMHFGDKDEEEWDRLSVLQLAEIIRTTQRVTLWWD